MQMKREFADQRNWVKQQVCGFPRSFAWRFFCRRRKASTKSKLNEAWLNLAQEVFGLLRKLSWSKA